MASPSPLTLARRRPAVAGTGFIALDVIIEAGARREFSLRAGGTCGNVLTILSYLGWQAFPVARLGGDPASSLVEEDLARWGVHLDHVGTSPGSPTPIVLHQIAKASPGLPSHRYSWTCPNCGNWLPGYRPVPASAARRVASRLGRPKVFFLDRVSPGALILARACRRRGALVVLEPSGFGEPRLFREALRLAHVFKYSDERIRSFGGAGGEPGPLLEIETLGAEGLRYRSRIPGAATDGWQRMDAHRVSRFKDAAGAGDWCTAGIVHGMGQEGLAGFLRARRPRLERALKLGQALAAWTCRYPGARGGMYAVDKRTFRRQVHAIIAQDRSRTPRRDVASEPVRQVFERICPACAATAAQSRKNRAR